MNEVHTLRKTTMFFPVAVDILLKHKRKTDGKQKDHRNRIGNGGGTSFILLAGKNQPSIIIRLLKMKWCPQRDAFAFT